MAEKRTRFFSIVTYIQDTDRVLSMVLSKRTSIRSYAVIKHDHDEADTHHHIVVRTHCTWTAPAVNKWFKDIETGQNTFTELVYDRSSIIDYLTHENDPDKYHYDKDAVIDGGIDDILPKGETADDTAEIVEKLLQGVSLRELVKLYGKDFVYHYSSYKAIIEDITGCDIRYLQNQHPNG